MKLLKWLSVSDRYAKAYLDEKSISYVERTVSSQNEVQQATQSIVTECDAIYLPTDNVFASTMPMVQEVTVAQGIPTICGENGMVQNGGFASLGLTYYDLGYKCGQMAYDILVNGAAFCVNPYLIQIRHNVIGCHNIVFIRFPQEKLQDKIGL